MEEGEVDAEWAEVGMDEGEMDEAWMAGGEMNEKLGPSKNGEPKN